MGGKGTCLNKFSLTTASTSCAIYYACIFPALKTLACKGQSGWRAVCFTVEFCVSGSSVKTCTHATCYTNKHH